MACAAIDDVTAWCLLALVVGVVQSKVNEAILVGLNTGVLKVTGTTLPAVALLRLLKGSVGATKWKPAMRKRRLCFVPSLRLSVNIRHVLPHSARRFHS